MPAQTFTDLLPPTKSARGAGFKWTPSDDNHGCGLLRIEAVRVSVTYLVVEFANQFGGRSWHLAKVNEGTDKDSDCYDVFCGRSGRGHQCSCKGFAYGKGKNCKHIESMLTIVKEGWDRPVNCPVNPDADTGSTELNELPETI